MKLKIDSGKGIEFEIPEEFTPSVFSIHCTQIDDYEFSKADRTSVEIEEALKNDQLPTLFLTSGENWIVPCAMDRCVYGSSKGVQYEFSGFTNYCGKIVVAIDKDGNAFVPK